MPENQPHDGEIARQESQGRERKVVGPAQFGDFLKANIEKRGKPPEIDPADTSPDLTILREVRIPERNGSGITIAEKSDPVIGKKYEVTDSGYTYVIDPVHNTVECKTVDEYGVTKTTEPVADLAFLQGHIRDLQRPMTAALARKAKEMRDRVEIQPVQEVVI